MTVSDPNVDHHLNAHMQGDLVVHLAEAAREELDKPVRDISRPRLQSLLELAIRTSSVAQVGACNIAKAVLSVCAVTLYMFYRDVICQGSFLPT